MATLPFTELLRARRELRSVRSIRYKLIKYKLINEKLKNIDKKQVLMKKFRQIYSIGHFIKLFNY
jgi:hypothetical protein